jgi:hypothetical protein
MSTVLGGAAIFFGLISLVSAVFVVVLVRRPSSTIDPALNRGTYLYAASLFAAACLFAAGVAARGARLPLVLAGVILYAASYFQIDRVRQRERTLPTAPGPMKPEQAARLHMLARRSRRNSIMSTLFVLATAPVFWSYLGPGWGIAWILLGCFGGLHGALHAPQALTGIVRERGIEPEHDTTPAPN